ncbi:MAG: ABC transporter substrate-binding protein [Lachnospiraceae bacterium]|nr:ABC transporter substrate-binding protein [Lachnospiraceae bacterium]
MKQKQLLNNIYILLLLISICLTGCGRISDGDYAASVRLEGGSGRAYIESPCNVTVKNGQASARIVWSSPHYDYMIVGGKTYNPVNTEGNSEFEIPVDLGKDMQVKADTVAMSEPHLIDYTIRFEINDDSVDNGKADIETAAATADIQASLDAPTFDGLDYISTDENEYAKCFAIHRYSDGFACLIVNDGRKYLLLPEGKNVPEKIDPNTIVLQRPLDNIYLAASAAMCHFDAISAVDNISLSGIEKDDWYIESAKKQMESGKLIYGGKYSAPDYEMMVEKNIDLAVESTMILHTPKVQEKIEQLDIPVFIDRSSYEDSPLGRCEWVKVYGLLTEKESEAASSFSEQRQFAESFDKAEMTGKKVAFFSLNSNHQIVTRKKNDYLAKMIELAGGTYLTASDDLGETSSSQLTISTEAFYDYASSADIIIYNTAIEEAPASLEKLIGMDMTFKNFSAMQEGKVWCTDKSLYQYANEAGKIIYDLHEIVSNEVDSTDFFYKLK